MMNSYVRQIDSKTKIAATDMAYAITSLLECPRNLKKSTDLMEISENRNPNMMMGSNQQQNKTKVEKENILLTINKCLEENFYTAYDALEMHNQHLLFMGIDLAKEIQQAIVSIGISLIERKEVKLGPGYRYAMIENDYLKDVQLFQFPLAL